MPVLDSNLLIRLDHDDPVAVRALERLKGAPLVVPFQAALEFAAGASDPADAIQAIAAAFHLERPEAQTLEDAAARLHATRGRGHRVLGGDAWIAACAALRGDYVVTTNKRDFRRLGVSAWNYVKESKPPA